MTLLSRYPRLPLYLMFGAAAATPASIAASQILLGAALLAMLLTGARWRFPPVVWPLGVFVGGTLLSALWARDLTLALPSLKKFYVLVTLAIVYSVFRNLLHARRLVLLWGAVTALSAVVSLVQFAQKWKAAGRLGADFYQYYVPERISGFMSHWMTLGGLEMMALLLLLSAVFFLPLRRPLTFFVLAAAALIALSLLLGFTRTIWMGAAAGSIYLVWFWRPKLLLGAPVLAALLLVAGPEALRSRIYSIVRPQREYDSNLHRVYCVRTGWEMIKANPWLGVGPEQVGRRFLHYLPPDLPLPLPTGFYGHLHNLYIHYAAERGVPVALALIWFLVKVLWDFLQAARRLARQETERRFLLHGAAACTLAIMLSGLFEVNLGDSEVLAMYLTVVGLGYAARDTTGAPPSPEVSHV